jgi:hypothetical protein
VKNGLGLQANNSAAGTQYKPAASKNKINLGATANFAKTAKKPERSG